MNERVENIDDRYHISGLIARGGMADVYEAYDIISKKTVAIKIMREDIAQDRKNIARFERECIAASSLNSPSVVKVYGQGVIDSRPYMVNEFVKGQTLRDKLNLLAVHKFSNYEASQIMLELTNGVEYIHQHGIVHRDIKPDNLFYLADGSVKISDFGISTQIGEKNTGDSVSGTVHYTAPEILLGDDSIPSSDIYSLGIVYFELLTGKVPFDAANVEDIAVKQIRDHLPIPSSIDPDIPKSIDKIIVKATRKRPEERYASAKEMHDDIALALKEGNNFIRKKSFFAKLFGFQ